MAEGGNARKKVRWTVTANMRARTRLNHSYIHPQGVVLCKPIVYGNVARYFGKKRDDDGHTHTWTCYLRPFKNEVLGTCTLHYVYSL